MIDQEKMKVIDAIGMIPGGLDFLMSIHSGLSELAELRVVSAELAGAATVMLQKASEACVRIGRDPEEVPSLKNTRDALEKYHKLVEESVI